jgi:hypothetical protein
LPGRYVLPPSPGIATTPGVNYSDPKAMLALMGGESQEALRQSQTALQPVLAHLLKLLGGDAQAIDEAMLPETESVLTQYDTARRAISEFAPRGGGQAGALAQSRLQAASDVAMLRSLARRSAVGELAQIGLNRGETGMRGLGVTTQGALQEAESRRKMWTDLGVGIGMMAANLFAPGSGTLLDLLRRKGGGGGGGGGGWGGGIWDPPPWQTQSLHLGF